jgi:small subunit ribosomal protein S17
MPRKKEEELNTEGNAVEVSQNETADDNAVEASADETAVETATDANAEAETEAKPKRTRKAKSEDVSSNDTAADETNGEGSIVNSVVDVVSSVVGGVANAVLDGVSSVVSAVTGDSTTDEPKPHHSKRAEKIGIVQSDKMTKTVTVRVDRVVKHPVYRKYIKRRKKFMAHDELGAAIGDKVRIMETRPLSARKRWRVVEIVQKAVK